METLVLTYAVAAAAVGAYVARLVIGSRRISCRLQQLQTKSDRKPGDALAKKIA
jgi:hypothetical protein